MSSDARAGQGRVGSLVAGKWRIVKRLGVGGSARVYSAVHEKNGFKAAIKVLNRDIAQQQDKESRARFLREGYLANSVDHEGVVGIIDDGVTEDGCPFLLMELLEGETLEDRRMKAGGRLPLEEALQIGVSVAEILAAAHDAKLVHRDVKPANVFLTTSGAIKLLDFGIAGRPHLGGEGTLTGVGIGTPRFMAPEQFDRHKGIDVRADVFALGATLFRVLTGDYPYDAITLQSYVIALSSSSARRADEVVPSLPPHVTDVIAKALDRDPSRRYANGRELATALARVLRGDGEVRPSGPVVLKTVVMPDRPVDPEELIPTELMPTRLEQSGSSGPYTPATGSSPNAVANVRSQQSTTVSTRSPRSPVTGLLAATAPGLAILVAVVFVALLLLRLAR